MIVRMTGLLTRVLDDEARLAVGPIEYQVLVPEAVRRTIQFRTGQEVVLHISEYLEGNSGGNRFVPRKLGFLTEAEVEFFDLFCTVEKIGAKKALKAMARPVRDIADAIQRQDAKWLSTLPGIGATTAEQVIATLKRKVAKFLARPAGEPVPAGPAGAAAESAEPTAVVSKASTRRKPPAEPAPVADAAAAAYEKGRLIEDVYEALMGLGHNPVEARGKLDALLASGKAFESLDGALTLIYGRGQLT